MSCFAYFLNGIRPFKEDEPRVEDNFGFIHPWQTDHETKRVYLFGRPRPEKNQRAARSFQKFANKGGRIGRGGGIKGKRGRGRGKRIFFKALALTWTLY